MSTDDSSAAVRGSGFSAGLGLVERLRRLAPHMTHQQDRDVFIEAAVELERLQADHARMNALDEPGRRWTFWAGKTDKEWVTTICVQPYQRLRDQIDSFYKLKA